MELSNFIKMTFYNGQFESNQIISSEILKEMMTP